MHKFKKNDLVFVKGDKRTFRIISNYSSTGYELKDINSDNIYLILEEDIIPLNYINKELNLNNWKCIDLL